LLLPNFCLWLVRTIVLSKFQRTVFFRKFPQRFRTASTLFAAY